MKVRNIGGAPVAEASPSLFAMVRTREPVYRRFSMWRRVIVKLLFAAANGPVIRHFATEPMRTRD